MVERLFVALLFGIAVGAPTFAGALHAGVKWRRALRAALAFGGSVSATVVAISFIGSLLSHTL